MSRPFICRLAGRCHFGGARLLACRGGGSLYVSCPFGRWSSISLHYERGREQAAVRFSGHGGCFVYLGWIGSYLIDLRSLRMALGG